jgi:hypothetical protein
MSQIITIVVKGGCVVDVLNLPEGFDYVIDDQDCEDQYID